MASFFSSAKYAVRRVACASSVVVGSGCSGVISECSFVIPGALGKWCQGWSLISCFVCCLTAARPTDDSAQGPVIRSMKRRKRSALLRASFLPRRKRRFLTRELDFSLSKYLVFRVSLASTDCLCDFSAKAIWAKEARVPSSTPGTEETHLELLRQWRERLEDN